jgi:heparinase II/III-like protein
LRALGENLVVDSGYADYYKDPYYDDYFKQAAGHNTVLVDGDPASQSIADTLALPALHEYPRIVNTVMSADLDGVTSELQQVYRGRLKKFSRSIVFMKPDYVIVYDELLPTERAAFDWLLHLPDLAGVTTKEATAFYNSKAASLAIGFLSPPNLKLQVTGGHLAYSTFNPVAPAVVPAQPAILHASTSTYSDAVRFLAVLAPARSSDAARERLIGLHRIETPAWIGIERNGSSNERLLFRKGSEMRPNSFDTWTTDAAAWLVRGEPNQLQLLAGLGVTILKQGSETWFSSEHPASFAATYQSGRTALSVYSVIGQTVRLREPDGKTEQISIGPGSHEFHFTWGRAQ